MVVVHFSPSNTIDAGRNDIAHDVSSLLCNHNVLHICAELCGLTLTVILKGSLKKI